MRSALLVVIAFGCGSSSESPPEPRPAARDAAAPAGVSAVLDVRVDRRVELISILHRLGGGPEYRGAAPSAYVAAVDRHFAPFARHPAVAATAQLRARHGIGFDAPMWFALHLDDRLALVNAAELPALDRRFAGVDVAAYAARVREFAAASNFDAFFAASAPLYVDAVAALRAIADRAQPIGWFDAVFGPRPRTHYAAIAGMLTGAHNFGPHATRADGSVEIAQILGVGAAGAPPPTAAATTSLLVHELAHAYVNPVFARHHAALEPAGRALFDLVAPRMRAQHYADWQTVLNESAVRALTVLYVRERRGGDAGAAAARDELRAGFAWINELVEVFRKHARDRAGTSLDAAMPQVIAAFDGLVRQYGGALPKQPFIGPIDAAYAGDVAFIAPTASAALARYARQIQQRRFPAAPFHVAGDAAALLAALPDRNLVVYGSPATNPLVAAIAEWARWKITPVGIELGARTYAGGRLVLIASWFRRDDPTKAAVVYASAADADLVDVNNVRHGATDWMIVRRAGPRWEVVAQGNWPMSNGAWIPPY